MRCKLAPFFKSTELFGFFAILPNASRDAILESLDSRNDILVIQPGPLLEPAYGRQTTK